MRGRKVLAPISKLGEPIANTIGAIVDGFEQHPDRSTMFFYQQSRGAITRVAENATAFANRNAINGPAVVIDWNEGVNRNPIIFREVHPNAGSFRL